LQCPSHRPGPDEGNDHHHDPSCLQADHSPFEVAGRAAKRPEKVGDNL
jgi:hypothetical protein